MKRIVFTIAMILAMAGLTVALLSFFAPPQPAPTAANKVAFSRGLAEDGKKERSHIDEVSIKLLKPQDDIQVVDEAPSEVRENKLYRIRVWVKDIFITLEHMKNVIGF